MSQRTQWVDNVGIQVDGKDIDYVMIDAMIDLVIDSSLTLPDMFTLRLRDEALEWIDSSPFEIGKSVLIRLGAKGDDMAQVFSGEVTAIEPDFTDEQTATLTIRGYDRSHRLSRGTKSRVFVEMSDSEIVSAIAKESQLNVIAESTSPAYQHVYQHNQTDLAFLQARARRNGFELYVDESTLYFQKPQGGRGSVALDWGINLKSFFPRMSVSGQVDEVVVKGWDPATKQAIVGQAKQSNTTPQINVGGAGGEIAKQAFFSAKQVVVRRSVRTQTDADVLAQSILDEINAGFVVAEGVADGTPKLIAGNKVNIQSIGNRFSGDYIVTTAVHVYTQDGYEVHLTVEGIRPHQLTQLSGELNGTTAVNQAWWGVVPAIVTNNNAPNDTYRVKLKFPWVDDQLESDWVRVVGIGAGNERGLHWLPEINDEVLVAFEHGDFNRPYVIGGLWNGKDVPPEPTSATVKDGKVETRLLKTRTGHTIRLVDQAGSSCIEIVDADGKNQIKLDLDGNQIIIKSDGEINITSDGDTNIEASGNAVVHAQGELELKADSNITVEARGNLTLKGNMVNIN